MDKAIKSFSIKKFKNSQWLKKKDVLAIEAPVEIRIIHPKYTNNQAKPISITMRSPGKDQDLALGFLFTEGILKSAAEVEKVTILDANTIVVGLKEETVFDLGTLDRNFYTNSSCGVCGKSSIDSIKTISDYKTANTAWKVPAGGLLTLTSKMNEVQSLFDETGGIHAAALFDKELNLLQLREDVGRHNALDKLIGHFFQVQEIPLHEKILMLSGRASFELIQKACMAAIPIVVAVGAPSSLALELAEENGITLIGFLKENSFNVYSHPIRIH